MFSLRVLLVMAACAAPSIAFAQSEEPAAGVTLQNSAERTTGFKLRALQFGTGAAAALVSAPAALGGAIWLGSLSSNLILAALPAFALFVALPPIAVTSAAWWMGERLNPGASRFSPAIWVGVGAQVAVLAGAILLGVHGHNLMDVALLTVVEALVLPGAVVGTMTLSAPKALPPSASARAMLPDPSRPRPDRVAALPLVAWSF